MPRVSCRSAVLAGVLLLVPDLARAQSTPSEDRAPALSATVGATQPTPVTRHWRNEWFRDRDYFDPLIAEPRAPQIAFTFPAWTGEFQFSVEPGTRLVWEVSLGREIPIFTRSNFDDATRGLKGSQGFGLWVDVSFHMIEDMGKDPSNPIINTDYRFSLAKLKYYRVLSVSPAAGANPVRRWKSIAFRADLYHHESTHLGDEFVINGQGAHPGEFERQNVSFEFYDLTGAFNWESGDGLLHSIRGGTTGLVKPSHGYYSDHTLEYPSQRDVFKSERNLEPYVQYEFHAPHRTRLAADPFGTPGGATPGQGLDPGAGAFERPVRWAPFVSADLRRRIVLDFNKASADVKEDTQWSLNLLGGIRSQAGNFRFAIKEIYGRFYYGVNPHGQLRTQDDYWLAGFGVNFAVGDR
jgi:Protein of unknown function (DUF1207)